MKSAFKKIVLAAAVIGFFALSSCEKHTCPTYSKIEVKHQNSDRV
ncbi:MAG TPA: hypothetical protein PLW44_04155 [Chitinophagales bacterium]|jgi:outer membrane protein assembly factor BamE (lipoprotein component of BamABCDE complex)|nr:hypothetical protein [Chitinophagales bacterium]